MDRLLKHHASPDKFIGRTLPKKYPVILDNQTGEELYIIEALLKQKQSNKKTKYLVKWLGYPVSETSWELEKDIKHVSHWNKLLHVIGQEPTTLTHTVNA